MKIKTCTTELEQFRQQIYQNFNNRADTLMELVDAICSNPQAKSVVEYSLTPCFRRSYSTIFKAQFAHTLADRGMVYQPNPIKGKKPVTIGHQFSTAVHRVCEQLVMRRMRYSTEDHFCGGPGF